MDMPPTRKDDAALGWDTTHAQGVQIGANNTQYNSFGFIPPVVRSAYVEQVRRIAPPDLKDRDAELAELMAFCTGDSDSHYAWWRAPAWAGKSALMSWFVLHPPSGVRIVSFFVTARQYRQNDRKAFLDSVSEQLADLLGRRGLPPGLTETTQEAHVLNMLVLAADACRRSGERLILLVDGLDEDRGVTVGPDSYSIAATLPRNLPEGLRVVVSSRPDPPLPFDVPADHPLQGRCTVLELRQSAYAEVVRADAERELKRILHAGGAERTILGFVTAASSGLSVSCLAQLTREDEWLVEDHLTSFTGRTFSRVGDAYVLAHEELQSMAERLFGPSRLREYRERLHEWASLYRAQDWPADTPAYLLLGYFRMLYDQRDHARIVQLATDTGRHDRMLDHTGGDAVAFEELALAQTALAANNECDLVAMCRLALHRADLERRNRHMPIGLPRLWAAVGNLTRAEALVRSIREDGGIRAGALSLLAPEVARVGHHADAERLVGLMPDRVFIAADEPGKAISEVARRIAEGGGRDRALTVARGAPSPFWQSRAFCGVAVGIARAGESLSEAETLVSQIPMPYWRAQALVLLAEEAVHRSEPDLADRLADDSVAEVDALTSSVDKALLYGFLADRLKRCGSTDRARQLASSAMREATYVREAQQRVETLTKIVPHLAPIIDRAELSNLAGLADEALADLRHGNEAAQDFVVARLAASVGAAWYVAGHPERAASVVGSIADKSRQASAMREVIASAAEAGDLDYARRLADSHPDADDRDQALVRIIGRAVEETDDENLARLADAIKGPAARASALTSWGYHAAARGDKQSAIYLAERAESISRSTNDAEAELELLVPLVSALATLGDLERAHKAGRRAILLWRTGQRKGASSSTLTSLVRGAASAKDFETAVEAAELINEPWRRAAVLIELAPSLVERDEPHLLIEPLAGAVEAAKTEQSSLRRAPLLEIMTAWWVLGENQRAESLAAWITRHEKTSGPPSLPALSPVSWPTPGNAVVPEMPRVAWERDQALIKAVETVAHSGDFTRAESLIDLIAAQSRQGEARKHLVAALARAGQDDRAYTVAWASGSTHQRGTCLQQLSEILAERGALDAAERTIRSIEDEFRRGQASIAVARKIEPARARPFLISPIQQGRLAEVIDLLASTCPEAVEALADHLLDDRANQARSADL